MSESITVSSQVCKNCSVPLSSESKFCNACGAKIVHERITVKNLVSNFLQNSFGWDNKFFVTIKYLILRPGELLRQYFDGTRKKYVNPFTFIAIGMAINLFVFNTFDQEFYEVMDEFNASQVAFYADTFGEKIFTKEIQKKQFEEMSNSTRTTLKYFNLIVLVTMPIYTFIAFLTYRKPYNYGEHIVVNCYIQGFNFLSTTLVFFASVAINPAFYFLILPLLLFYYTYIYGKLYKLSVGKSLLKVILFMAILAAVFIICIVIGFIHALLSGL